MTNAGIFFAGVGTTILLIGAGFSGGLMLAQTAMEPMTAASSRAAGRLPPARVILPASAEAAEPPQPPSATDATPARESAPQHIQANEVQQSTEWDRAAERAEQRKADDRERRKRVAERKAKRDAERLAKQQQEQQAPGIMAFGRDDEHPPAGGGFFGN